MGRSHQVGRDYRAVNARPHNTVMADTESEFPYMSIRTPVFGGRMLVGSQLQPCSKFLKGHP